jgi:hypothetical protein
MSRGVLRLQSDYNGGLWYGNDHDVAVPSGMTAEEFLETGLPSDLKELQLVGSVCNARLIEQLYMARQRGDLGLPRDLPIRLGSPSGCAAGSSCEDALRALWQRDMVEGPACRWVNLSQREYTSYALLSALLANDWEPNDTCRTIIRYHPAWLALSFIPTLNVDAACVLLGLIIDPRWFVHEFRPNRINRLCRYLGLTPANLKFLTTKLAEPDHRLSNCKVVIKTWAGDLSPVNAVGASGFLHLGLLRNPGSKGLLNACKRFIRFVREVWLNELSLQKKLFDPDMFFKSSAVADAYYGHQVVTRKRSSSDTCA